MVKVCSHLFISFRHITVSDHVTERILVRNSVSVFKNGRSVLAVVFYDMILIESVTDNYGNYCQKTITAAEYSAVTTLMLNHLLCFLLNAASPLIGDITIVIIKKD